jgi:hypothetical protein
MPRWLLADEPCSADDPAEIRFGSTHAVRCIKAV